MLVVLSLLGVEGVGSSGLLRPKASWAPGQGGLQGRDTGAYQGGVQHLLLEVSACAVVLLHGAP